MKDTVMVLNHYDKMQIIKCLIRITTTIKSRFGTMRKYFLPVYP